MRVSRSTADVSLTDLDYMEPPEYIIVARSIGLQHDHDEHFIALAQRIGMSLGALPALRLFGESD